VTEARPLPEAGSVPPPVPAAETVSETPPAALADPAADATTAAVVLTEFQMPPAAAEVGAAADAGTAAEAAALADAAILSLADPKTVAEPLEATETNVADASGAAAAPAAVETVVVTAPEAGMPDVTLPADALLTNDAAAGAAAEHAAPVLDAEGKPSQGTVQTGATPPAGGETPASSAGPVLDADGTALQATVQTGAPQAEQPAASAAGEGVPAEPVSAAGAKEDPDVRLEVSPAPATGDEAAASTAGVKRRKWDAPLGAGVF